MPTSDLENVIETKIKPIIDDAMQKFIGARITELNTDLTDKIKRSPLMDFEISFHLPFKLAKKQFKKHYLLKLLQNHLGNISDAANIAGIDRRSIHRLISQLGIRHDHFRKELVRSEYVKREALMGMIDETLLSYKAIIQPEKLAEMYRNIPNLSKNIVQHLPDSPLTLKEAEIEFEKRYLKFVLTNNKNNITKTAKQIKLRYETLHRKLRSLNLI